MVLLHQITRLKARILRYHVIQSQKISISQQGRSSSKARSQSTIHATSKIILTKPPRYNSRGPRSTRPDPLTKGAVRSPRIGLEIGKRRPPAGGGGGERPKKKIRDIYSLSSSEDEDEVESIEEA